MLISLAILFPACSQSQIGQTPQPVSMEPVDSYSLVIVIHPEFWSHYPRDEQGVVLVHYKNELGIQYNPVTIAQYALANYQQYLLTGESKYKDEFLTQVEYLRNNFDITGDDMIGFPYYFPMPDYGLEPPWYSGMAQGQVISVLARAYIITQDETLLPPIKQARNFMLCTTCEGGTLTYTPEGNVWIEEYPSEKPSLVLNGFMFCILGLYDYTQLFPDDTETYQIYRDCLESLKKSLRYYDTGSWLKYSRMNDNLAGRHYMRVQVRQMRQLFALTGDEYFDTTAVKWESYLQDEEANCIETEGWYHVPPEPKNLAALDNIEGWDTTEVVSGKYSLSALLDNDQHTYFAPLKKDISEENPHYIHLKLRDEVMADSVVLTLYNKELFPETLDILYRSNKDTEWHRLDVQAIAGSDGWSITYRFDEVSVSELKLVCEKAAGQNRLVFAELALNRSGEFEATGCGLYYPDAVEITSPYFEVRLTVRDISEGHIFVMYKYADEIEQLEEKAWDFQTINPLEANRIAKLGKYYQFKVIFKNETLNSGFTGFTVIPRQQDS